MKRKKYYFCASVLLLIAFVLWTLLVSFVGLSPIGPNGSMVGLSGMNSAIKELIGVRLTLYVITDWLGLVPIAVAFSFAILGLCQWVKRKRIIKVDRDILLLGVFYIIVFATYVTFEFVVINRRPILINGYHEASYPSSTTMLVACVMPTAIMQFNSRVKRKWLKILLSILISFFIGFMVIGRVLSGVHWLSDIIGGFIFSAGVVIGYYGLKN